MNTTPKLKFLVADDHDFFLEGLIKMLALGQDHLTIVGKAYDGQELVELTRKHLPDFILTDIGMPNMDGIEATKIIKQDFPEIKIIALSCSDSDDSILCALDAGVNGYLLKNIKIDELIAAIVEINNGDSYYSREIHFKLKVLINRSRFNPYKKIENLQLSELEMQIIQGICEEYLAKEIANNNNINVRIVEAYKKRISKKLHVKNSVGIAIYAIKNGLIKI
jgi:DNA-binding NarL/FixJ family response regulator